MLPIKFGLLLLLIHLSGCAVFYSRLKPSGTHYRSLHYEREVINYNYFSPGNWKFTHLSREFRLKIISVEFNEASGSCQGELRIRNQNQLHKINCKSEYTDAIHYFKRANGYYQHNGYNYNGYHHQAYMESDNVKFIAIIELYPSVSGSFGNFSETGENQQFYVHTYAPRLVSDTYSYGTNFSDFIDENRFSSSDIITFGDFSGTVSRNGSILVPASDIPSCHADAVETCQWSSTVRADYYNKTSNIQGKSFMVTNNIVEFETINNALYLEKTCIDVMYISNDSSVLMMYIRGKEKRTDLISTTILNQVAVLTNRRLRSSIPKNVKGTPVSIVIQISGSSPNPLFVKRIYGCNPYTHEDQFAIPAINDVYPMVYTVEGLKSLGNVNFIDIPHSIKELKEDPQCLNGGKLDGSKCVCPAGYTGNNCQTGCGENKFGPNCESRCSFHEMKCKGKLICRPSLGCSCAPGWQGIYCNLGCRYGWYGADCRFRCGRCRDSSLCDKFTGVCSKNCEPGYVPPLCQTRNSYIVEKPAVTDITFNSTVVTITLGSDTNDIHFYALQYKNLSSDSDVWLETDVKALPQSLITEKLEFLKAGTRYEVRLVSFNKEMSSYKGDDLPSVVFETHCVDNSLDINERVTETTIFLEWKETSNDVNRCESKSYEVQVLFGSDWQSYSTVNNSIELASLVPGTKYTIRIRQIRKESLFLFKSITTLRKITGRVENSKVGRRTQYSIELEWDNDNDEGSSYEISYQCLTILSNRQDCRSDNGTLNINRSVVVIEGLRPYRKYQFHIRELPGSDYIEIETTTKPAVPEVPPELVSLTATNASLVVSWSPPKNCSDCNGFITGYFFKALAYKDVIVVSEETKSTVFVMKNLTPGTPYKLYIYIMNTEGKSTLPLVVDVITKSTVPTAVVDLVAYKTGRREVGLRWGRPRDMFGNLLGFSIDKLFMVPTPCTAWPSEYCHTITNLSPDTAYNFSVCARNDELDEDGVCSFISATTTEKAPEEPLNLKVFNETENSISISWEPPRLFNGVLRSFMIKVEQTESFNLTDCCQEHPKIEIRVKKELPRYESQISGLSGGSKFAVSVMGETVWLGPAARVSGCTRPPTPQQPNPPTTIIHPSDNTTIPLTWPHPSPTSNDPTSLTLIKDNVLLVLPTSNATPVNESVWDEEDLKILVDKEFPGQRYYLGAHYKGDGEYVEVGGLLSGHSYRLALLTVAEYCRLYAVAVTTSLEFTAP